MAPASLTPADVAPAAADLADADLGFGLKLLGGGSGMGLLLAWIPAMVRRERDAEEGRSDALRGGMSYDREENKRELGGGKRREEGEGRGEKLCEEGGREGGREGEWGGKEDIVHYCHEFRHESWFDGRCWCTLQWLAGYQDPPKTTQANGHSTAAGSFS